ncbi:protein O-mannosyltransferase 1 isoform X1 [Drosophila elegans]|uniref:protein O-mannosyltransferase 1 isoform X1 n=1 Tax=Drosophila elegans TaxID=30023 RepID=UPI0007E700CD|nr:protein O-mannosyltransferase 1 isoform X1 [Drosophila elegans]XP_017133951.1 protein O-mannosyltransferase 1 isoform X1 [Drosophila elegans]
MSATYTNTITQRRKAGKVRQQQQQCDLSGEPNERLHFRSRSTNSKATTTAAVVGSSPSPLCCNGALTLLNCCVDVNCHLNAPLRGSVSRHTTPTPTLTATPTPAATPKQASPSPTSDRSRSLSPSPSPTRSRSLSCHKHQHKSSAAAAVAAEEREKSNTVLPPFTVRLSIDLFSWSLFLLAFGTRFYKLATPPNIVFDELHYGKYISMYMRNVFFFDQHPPLGKQLIAGLVSLAGYNGNYTFSRIGEPYSPDMPIFWFRFVPAMCGSLLAPAVYKLLLEAKLSRWSSALGGLLVVLDNSLLTQSRFVLMESMLLLASTLGIACLLRFQRSRLGSLQWLLNGSAAAVFLGAAGTVKYIGFLALGLAFYMLCRHLWQLLYDATLTNRQLWMHAISRLVIFVGIPIAVYVGVFYVHFRTLHRAGPHDSIMTSAFQASLEGGLASITRGQPLAVVHGSQITLRHTHGRTCWLHSHAAVYPVRYPDKRGSSHQQQVTCYSFKDVNNWWLVKRPTKENLVVGDNPDVIRHGDIIQLVHGITSRALNSHDVAAAMTPQCQEVSCYIDYEIKMAGELLWRVEILNRDSEGDSWHAIKSEIRLVHETTGATLKFSGRQLPDWGFNQHEVVADRERGGREDTIWNVEEHRYTQTEDHRERERQLLSAEMIPTKRTRISFWAKLLELQSKMLFQTKSVPSHMYSSMPHEWPLMDKGIAYWLDSESSAQIYLLGNVLIWYTATTGILVYAGLLAFYAARRQRLCFDISEQEWQRFLIAGDTFFVGYLIHYLPYFFVDRTLFLHNYLPAFVFKLLLLSFVADHLDYLLRRFCTGRGVHLVRLYRLMLILWLVGVISIFFKFIPLSYGARKMSTGEVRSLRWKDTWDFVLHKNHLLH